MPINQYTDNMAEVKPGTLPPISESDCRFGGEKEPWVAFDLSYNDENITQSG